MDAPCKTELSERIREELKQLKEDSHSANFDLNKSDFECGGLRLTFRQPRIHGHLW